MDSIAVNLQAVRARIARAAQAAQRPAGDILLLAVSKTIPAERIAEAHAAGQRAFGENHAQEAVEKITVLATLPLDWHFIGPIQSNKTRLIAEHFSWAHSVEREKIAERAGQAQHCQREHPLRHNQQRAAKCNCESEDFCPVNIFAEEEPREERGKNRR